MSVDFYSVAASKTTFRCLVTCVSTISVVANVLGVDISGFDRRCGVDDRLLLTAGRNDDDNDDCWATFRNVERADVQSATDGSIRFHCVLSSRYQRIELHSVN